VLDQLITLSEEPTCPSKISPVLMLDRRLRKWLFHWPEDYSNQSKSLTGFERLRFLSAKVLPLVKPAEKSQSPNKPTTAVAVSMAACGFEPAVGKSSMESVALLRLGEPEDVAGAVLFLVSNLVK
jgi:hypothetical protein